MDTLKPAIFVNGALLPMHVRKRVRTVIQVAGSDHGSVVAKSTDDIQLIVKGSPPAVPPTTFVEVIGIADTEKSIQAEIWTNFGDSFDTFSYNQLCKLANGEYQHLFL
uniref:Replication protein A 14 kDa subunit B n=1 Tax=Rhizophora mucronata TaxID=61149 RepID=A0A2P2PSZ5_RHIMU